MYFSGLCKCKSRRKLRGLCRAILSQCFLVQDEFGVRMKGGFIFLKLAVVEESLLNSALPKRCLPLVTRRPLCCWRHPPALSRGWSEAARYRQAVLVLQAASGPDPRTTISWYPGSSKKLSGQAPKRSTFCCRTLRSEPGAPSGQLIHTQLPQPREKRGWMEARIKKGRGGR